MTSTDVAVCEKLNKETMMKNYIVGAINEEPYSKAPNDECFSRLNQLLPIIRGEVNTIMRAIEE